MSKAGVLAIAILMIGLTMATAGSVLPFGPQTVSANDPGASETPGTVTLRSQAGPGESAWTRLRWLFAGVAVSAVLLVARRQLLILIGCREGHGRLKVPEGRSAIRLEPGTGPPEAFPIALERDWFPSPAVSTAAER
jgi:hypothetical protein